MRKTDKLTDLEVQRIRALYSAGAYSTRKLGRQFGVSSQQISNIVTGKSRKVISSERFAVNSRAARIWKTIPKTERTATGFAAAPLGAVKDLKIKGPKGGLKIAVITDVQGRKGVRLDHLTWCGEYLKRKKPDVIVIIGDFGDFPSLSDYDKPGTMLYEGKRYIDDLDAFHKGMALLMNPIAKARNYNPKLVFTMGNHEDRIDRAINNDPNRLTGLMSLDDLELKEHGFDVYPFLQPVKIGGVAFCHYFPSGVKGQPISSPRILLSKMHMSCFAGHLQGRETAYARRGDGQNMTAIISGSFYQHKEPYLSPLTNIHWRGMYMLHEVRDGSFDEMAISIEFLKRKFKERMKT